MGLRGYGKVLGPNKIKEKTRSEWKGGGCEPSIMCMGFAMGAQRLSCLILIRFFFVKGNGLGFVGLYRGAVPFVLPSSLSLCYSQNLKFNGRSNLNLISSHHKSRVLWKSRVKIKLEEISLWSSLPLKPPEHSLLLSPPYNDQWFCLNSMVQFFLI